MPYILPSTSNFIPQNLNSSLQPDPYQTIDGIKAKLTPHEIQILQQYLASENIQNLHEGSQFSEKEKIKSNEYSSTIKLAFGFLKFFSLFMLGTGIAFVISASLQATSVVSILTGLLSLVFIPIAVMTFFIVAIAIILESFK